MTREELIKQLMIEFNKETHIELMNVLQDEGLVSDEAVTIDDVPTSDLQKAHEQT